MTGLTVGVVQTAGSSRQAAAIVSAGVTRPAQCPAHGLMQRGDQGFVVGVGGGARPSAARSGHRGYRHARGSVEARRRTLGGGRQLPAGQGARVMLRCSARRVTRRGGSAMGG